MSDSTAGVAILAGMLIGLERRGQAPTAATNILGEPAVGRLAERARALVGHAGERVQILALRVISSFGAEAMGPTFLRLAGGTNNLASAAMDAVFRQGDPDLVAALLRGWASYGQPMRQLVQQRALSKALGRRALIEAAEQGSVPWDELDRHAREALGKEPDPAWRERVQALESHRHISGRAEAIARSQKVLARSGRPEMGKAIFVARCAICHRYNGQGQSVGPDLTGIGARPAAALLVDILDPSRQVAPDYSSFTVETVDEDVWTGLLLRDDPPTLRLAGGEERVVPRARVKSLRANQRSLMPDGLEEGWSDQDLADLLAFLRPE